MIVHYDGTLAGLLTVCRRSEFSGEEEPAQIQRPPYPAPGLFDEIVEVATDGQLAAELRERIGRELSPRSADNIRLAFLSEHPGIEAAIWRYLALGRKVGRRLDCCLAHPDVHAVHCWARRTAPRGPPPAWAGPLPRDGRRYPLRAALRRRQRPSACLRRTSPAGSTVPGCCTTCAARWVLSARTAAICWEPWWRRRRSPGRRMRGNSRHSGVPFTGTSPSPTGSVPAVSASSCR